MSDLTKDDFTQNVRDALLGDPQLVRLLGGPHIFCAPPPDIKHPHITIAESKVPDWSIGSDIVGQRTVTLQVWPQTGAKTLAQEFLDTAHSALVASGLMTANAPIKLRPEFSGSRQVPESKEYHGILRYLAVRHGEAA